MKTAATSALCWTAGQSKLGSWGICELCEAWPPLDPFGPLAWDWGLPLPPLTALTDIDFPIPCPFWDEATWLYGSIPRIHKWRLLCSHWFCPCWTCIGSNNLISPCCSIIQYWCLKINTFCFWFPINFSTIYLFLWRQIGFHWGLSRSRLWGTNLVMIMVLLRTIDLNNLDLLYWLTCCLLKLLIGYKLALMWITTTQRVNSLFNLLFHNFSNMMTIVCHLNYHPLPQSWDTNWQKSIRKHTKNWIQVLALSLITHLPPTDWWLNPKNPENWQKCPGLKRSSCFSNGDPQDQSNFRPFIYKTKSISLHRQIYVRIFFFCVQQLRDLKTYRSNQIYFWTFKMSYHILSDVLFWPQMVLLLDMVSCGKE